MRLARHLTHVSPRAWCKKCLPWPVKARRGSSPALQVREGLYGQWHATAAMHDIEYPLPPLPSLFVATITLHCCYGGP